MFERTGNRFYLPVVRQTPPSLAVLAPAQNVLNAPFRSPENAFQTKKPLTRSGFLFERTGDRFCLPVVRQTPPPLAVLAPAQNVLNAPFRSPENAFQTKKPLTRSGFLFERTGDRTLDPQIKSLLLYQLSYPPDRKGL